MSIGKEVLGSETQEEEPKFSVHVLTIIVPIPAVAPYSALSHPLPKS